mmetsp:Transcript_99890/g.303199  ORF Transcript_99890/g.303199 Transcript_99890/m.303199 type:complete len:431 (-) Transcript_99890:9-1301(-)
MTSDCWNGEEAALNRRLVRVNVRVAGKHPALAQRHHAHVPDPERLVYEGAKLDGLVAQPLQAATEAPAIEVATPQVAVRPDLGNPSVMVLVVTDTSLCRRPDGDGAPMYLQQRAASNRTDDGGVAREGNQAIAPAAWQRKRQGHPVTIPTEVHACSAQQPAPADRIRPTVSEANQGCVRSDGNHVGDVVLAGDTGNHHAFSLRRVREAVLGPHHPAYHVIQGLAVGRVGAIVHGDAHQCPAVAQPHSACAHGARASDGIRPAGLLSMTSCIEDHLHTADLQLPSPDDQADDPGRAPITALSGKEQPIGSHQYQAPPANPRHVESRPHLHELGAVGLHEHAEVPTSVTPTRHSCGIVQGSHPGDATDGIRLLEEGSACLHDGVIRHLRVAWAALCCRGERGPGLIAVLLLQPIAIARFARNRRRVAAWRAR